MTQGGPREAVIRALLYVRLPEGVADERGFNLMRRMREEAGKGINLAEFKQLFREQFFMLLLDERRAVDAIPAMLAKDPKLAASLADTLQQLLGVVGIRTAAAKARLREIEAMFRSIGTLAPADMAKAQPKQSSLSGIILFAAPSAFDCSLACIQKVGSRMESAHGWTIASH